MNYRFILNLNDSSLFRDFSFLRNDGVQLEAVNTSKIEGCKVLFVNRNFIESCIRFTCTSSGKENIYFQYFYLGKIIIFAWSILEIVIFILMKMCE